VVAATRSVLELGHTARRVWSRQDLTIVARIYRKRGVSPRPRQRSHNVKGASQPKAEKLILLLVYWMHGSVGPLPGPGSFIARPPGMNAGATTVPPLPGAARGGFRDARLCVVSPWREEY
jgi:hypothetical protein